MDTFTRSVAATAFAASAVYLWIYGLRLTKTGQMDDTGIEHQRNLFLVNEVNSLRRRPTQENLTTRQVRVFGWIYVAVAPVSLVLALLTVLGVLR